MSYEFGPQGQEIANLLNPENRNALSAMNLRQALKPMWNNFGIDVVDILSKGFQIPTRINPETGKPFEPETVRTYVEDVSDLKGFIQPGIEKRIPKRIFRYISNIYPPNEKGANDFVFETVDTPVGKLLFVLSYPKDKRENVVTFDKGQNSERVINLENMQFSEACLLLPDKNDPDNYEKYKAVDLLELLKKHGVRYVGLLNSEQNINEPLPDVVIQDGILLVKDNPMDTEGLVVTNEGITSWPISDRYSWMTWLALSKKELSRFNPELTIQALGRLDINEVLEQCSRVLPKDIIYKLLQKINKILKVADKNRLLQIKSHLPQEIQTVLSEWLVDSDLDGSD